MTTIYEPLEIKGDDGQGTGKYRQVEHNSSFTWAYGLCDHEHVSKDEAQKCPEVVEKMGRVFPSFDECPMCEGKVPKGKLEALKQKHSEETKEHLSQDLGDDEPSAGQQAFERYNSERGGVNHQGDKTPDWGELPEGIRFAWEMAAEAVVNQIAREALSKYGEDSPLFEAVNETAFGVTKRVKLAVQQQLRDGKV